MPRQSPQANPRRDRIVELVRLPKEKILPNPLNWREHPPAQERFLSEMINEIGYADALIGVRSGDGVMLLDGHLRAEEAPPGTMLPILIVDLNGLEQKKLLATLDPLSALAEANAEKHEALLAEAELAETALAEWARATYEKEVTNGGRSSGGGPGEHGLTPGMASSEEINAELAAAMTAQGADPASQPLVTHECPNCGHKWSPR